MPPWLSISRLVASSLSAPRATRIGMAPALETWRAVTRPMPEEAPVITTVLPVSALTVAESLLIESSSTSSHHDHRVEE